MDLDLEVVFAFVDTLRVLEGAVGRDLDLDLDLEVDSVLDVDIDETDRDGDGERRLEILVSTKVEPVETFGGRPRLGEAADDGDGDGDFFVALAKRGLVGVFRGRPRLGEAEEDRDRDGVGDGSGELFLVLIEIDSVESFRGRPRLGDGEEEGDDLIEMVHVERLRTRGRLIREVGVSCPSHSRIAPSPQPLSSSIQVSAPCTSSPS